MSDTDGYFKHESLQDRDSIIKYLNAIGEGFQKGRILFNTKNKQFVLTPQGLLGLNVKAKKKDRKVKVYIKLTWVEHDDDRELLAEPLIITGEK